MSRPYTSTPFEAKIFTSRHTSDASIISSTSSELELGKCYTFSGTTGAVTLLFPVAIIPSLVQISHKYSVHYSFPYPTVIVDPADSCAPNMISIYGWTDSPTKTGLWLKPKRSAGNRVSYGNYYFDLMKSQSSQKDVASYSMQLQELSANEESETPSESPVSFNRTSIKALTLSVDSNHGNLQFTCIYRIKVMQ